MLNKRERYRSQVITGPTRNRVGDENRLVGSNPTLSAINKKAMKKIIFFSIIFISLFYYLSFAQDNSTSTHLNKNQQVVKNDEKIPICVDYKNVDKLGRILGLKLEEKLIASNLFRLNKDKGKCYKIIIKSKQEFNNSPLFRSVISIAWTFYYGEDVLSSFLGQEIFILDSNNIDLEAENILALTRSITKEYSYLLQ